MPSMVMNEGSARYPGIDIARLETCGGFPPWHPMGNMGMAKRTNGPEAGDLGIVVETRILLGGLHRVRAFS